MSIKQAEVLFLTTAMELDSVIAMLPQGKAKKSLHRIRSRLAQSSVLNEELLYDCFIQQVTRSVSPRQTAVDSFNSDFFANELLPDSLKRRVASFLVEEFGVQGNPLWQNYLSGKFKYVDVSDFEEEV